MKHLLFFLTITTLISNQIESFYNTKKILAIPCLVSIFYGFHKIFHCKISDDEINKIVNSSIDAYRNTEIKEKLGQNYEHFKNTPMIKRRFATKKLPLSNPKLIRKLNSNQSEKIETIENKNKIIGYFYLSLGIIGILFYYGNY